MGFAEDEFPELHLVLCDELLLRHAAQVVARGSAAPVTHPPGPQAGAAAARVAPAPRARSPAAAYTSLRTSLADVGVGITKLRDPPPPRARAAGRPVVPWARATTIQTWCEQLHIPLHAVNVGFMLRSNGIGDATNTADALGVSGAVRP